MRLVNAAIPGTLDFGTINHIVNFCEVFGRQLYISSSAILESALGMPERILKSEHHAWRSTHEEPGKGMTCLPSDPTQAMLS